MNDNDFKKMDDSFMDALKDLRQRKISNAPLKSLSSEVEKRILAKHHATGFTIGILATILILFAIGFAVWHFVLIPKTPPTPTPTAPQAVEVPSQKIISQKMAAAKPISLGTIKESEISDEIEALKELDVWSDEDDQAVGIPAETSFSEMEMDLEAAKPGINPAPQIH